MIPTAGMLAAASAAMDSPYAITLACVVLDANGCLKKRPIARQNPSSILASNVNKKRFDMLS